MTSIIDGCTRTRTKSTMNGTHIEQHAVSKSGVVTNNSLPAGYVGEVKKISDVNHKGWKKLRSAGKIVMGPLVLVRSSREASSGSIGYSNTAYPINEHTGDFAAFIEGAMGVNNTLSDDLVNLGQNVLIKAYAKVNSSPVLAGEVMADISQTILMLRKPFKSAQDLAKRMLSAKKLRLGKTANSAARATADVWLEYRYGWKPIMLDCNSIVDRVLDIRERADGNRFVARTGQSLSRTCSKDFTDVTVGWGLGTGKASGTTVNQLVVTASAGLLYCTKNSKNTSDVARTLGLQPKDVPATVWEIVPYSFVLDWFVGVGDWIQAVTPNPDVSILGAWLTTVTKSSISYSGGKLKWADGTPTTNGSWGGSRVQRDTITRDSAPVLSSTPVLTSRPMSVIHGLDSVALGCSSIISVLQSLKH